MCHGAAITRNTSALDIGRNFRRWRKLLVSSKYRYTMPNGKTSPIRLLVKTFIAHDAANPQHTHREGFSCCNDIQKKSKLSVIHKPTTMSGISNRVKMYGPSAVQRTTAEYNPPRSP